MGGGPLPSGVGKMQGKLPSLLAYELETSYRKTKFHVLQDGAKEIFQGFFFERFSPKNSSFLIFTKIIL
jgi:hypothetical protein